MDYLPAVRDAPTGSPRRLTRVTRQPAKARISDRVYEELLSAVRDLRLKPGALLSETELSGQLGVSRTPLREAITRLVDHGLVKVVAQVGTSVALIDLAAAEEACFIRGALETAAFRQACTASQRDVSGLREILLRQERAVAEGDSEAFFIADEELHQEIHRLSGYPGVWSVIVGSKLQLDRLRRLYLPEAITTRALVEEHIRIVDLLERGDAEAGGHLIMEHSRHILSIAPDIRAKHPDYFT